MAKRTKKDYKRMVVAASAVVLDNRNNQYRTGNPEYVLFTFPKGEVFVKGFPKGLKVAETETNFTQKINAVRLLDWLYSKKYSSYNSSMLVQQTRRYEIASKAIDRLFEGE